MSEKTTALTKSQTEIATALDSQIFLVLGSDALNGFEKAYAMSNAIGELKKLLTEEYMKPIMDLQGSRLGFKTDKDKTGGYPMEVVKQCLIDAVLFGLQPTGNQFNIIAGNMYPTKEGTGYILNNMKGLNYDIVSVIKATSPDGKSALVEATINWSINGQDKSKVVPIPIKTDAYTGVDAIIGKATRKARAWLISTLTGVEVTDGDVTDVPHTVVGSKVTQEEKENDRMFKLIESATTKAELKALEKDVPDELLDVYNSRLEELK